MPQATLVVGAQHRIDAHPILTRPAGIAIGIAAALRADIGRLPEAADQPVTAVVLIGPLGGGDIQHATALAGTLAAIGHRRADARIANLAITAVAIVAAGGAIAAVTRSAAQQIIAAAQLLIGANPRRWNAAFIFRNALVTTAAGISLETDQQEARVPNTGRALRAVGIDIAFTGLAMAVFAVTEWTLALVVFAAERAMRALFSLTAAEVIDWAFRHERADVVDAIDTRAEVRTRRDAIVGAAAFALVDAGAVTANTHARGNARTRLARLASVALDRIARSVPIAIEAIGALIVTAAHAAEAEPALITANGVVPASRDAETLLADIAQPAVIIGLAGLLRAGQIEPARHRDPAQQSAEQPLQRGAPRSAPRQCPRQGIESLIVHPRKCPPKSGAHDDPGCDPLERNQCFVKYGPSYISYREPREL